MFHVKHTIPIVLSSISFILNVLHLSIPLWLYYCHPLDLLNYDAKIRTILELTKLFA